MASVLLSMAIVAGERSTILNQPIEHIKQDFFGSYAIRRFSSEINGVKVDDVNPYSIETLGDPYITSNGGKKSGFCKVTCTLKDGRSRFGLYKTIRYKGFLSGFYCRIYVGWKLMDIAGANALNFKEFTQGDDKKHLKTVWCINPLKKVNQKGE